MRKFILSFAIALVACNIIAAKEYITLESQTGNTIVDEKGQWILGPYDNLHVEYIKGYNNNYVYGSFYENGQKRYVNLVELAYLPVGYEYEFYYKFAKAFTNGGFKLLNLDGTYAINDVITDYDDLSDTIILGKKGEYWYVYNRVSGNPIIDSPIRSIKESITKYWSRKDKKYLYKLYTIDDYTKYLTENGVLLSVDEAIDLINSNDYIEIRNNDGAGGDSYSDENFYSRAPSDVYDLFSEVDDKGNTLYGMKTKDNIIVIPPKYKSIKHLGKEFKYFVVTDENNRYGIVDSLDQTIVATNNYSYERLSDRSFILKDSYGNSIFNASSGVFYADVFDCIDTSKPNYVLNKVTTATYDKIKYVIDTNSGYKLFKLPHYDDDITSFYKALFVYKSKGKYGLMDYNGNIIIEPKFDKVTIDEPELAEYIKEIDSYDK